MYLSKLTIRNFRKIENLTVKFQEGLNVIVGPNNVGKTAVIDALRALLSWQDENYLRFTTDDIHLGSTTREFSFEYTFSGLTLDEEAEFLGALTFSQEITDKTSETVEVSFGIKYYENETGEYLKVKRWCGKFQESSITSDMFDNLRAIYLQPLRDVVQNLRSGRYSKQAHLLNHLALENEKETLNSLLSNQNDELKKNETITKLGDIVRKQHEEMLGTNFIQDLKIGLNTNDFNRLLSRLSISANDLEIDHNGLGYGNLIYMAVVLSELSNRKETLYKAVIIEEPEAHLHPQLQYVLLDYLKGMKENIKGINQIFISSHSPNLVSKASLDSLICLYESDNKVEAQSVSDIEIDLKDKRKLERYLSVTRAEIFFAKKIIFVEGISEQLLMDVLARKCGIDLQRNGISVINVEGINFDAFLPLFGETKALKIPVAVLTDSDTKGFPEDSQTVKGKKSIDQFKNKYVSIHYSKKTFEYDLALNNHSIMLQAYYDLRPQLAKELEEQLKITEENEKGKYFYRFVFTDRTERKGMYAQCLAEKINCELSNFVIPNYIEEALNFLTKDQ